MLKEENWAVKYLKNKILLSLEDDIKNERKFREQKEIEKILNNLKNN